MVEHSNGDIGECGEIFIADGAVRFAVGVRQSPQPEVDDLLQWGGVREDLVNHGFHTPLVWRSPTRVQREKSISDKTQSQPFCYEGQSKKRIDPIGGFLPKPPF